MTAGDKAGHVVSFAREGHAVSFGRSSDCTARFDETSVSRLHASAVWIADQYMIADAGSTNGTFVNGLRLSRTTSLEAGDQVRLGPVLTLRFSILDADEVRALVLAAEGKLRDPDTGLPARGYLEPTLDAEIHKAIATSHPLSLLMIAVDTEAISGSELLAGLSRVLRSGIRDADLLGYLGDNRFIVLARDACLEDARRLGERLRGDVDAAMLIEKSQQVKATVSVGVASLSCCKREVDRISLLSIAEQRTQLAKRRRNTVVSAGGTIGCSVAPLSDELTCNGAG